MAKHQKKSIHSTTPPYAHIVEKINVTEWLPIKQHSRMLYTKLRPEDIHIYDLQQDDMLLVRILVVRKAHRDLDKSEEGQQ